MREIGAFEAKTKLSDLLDLVEAGEEILIIRHGKAVAKLTPNTGATDVAKARAAASRIRERAAMLKFGKFDWPEWKAYRDQGRK